LELTNNMSSTEKTKTWEAVKFAVSIGIPLLASVYLYGIHSNKIDTIERVQIEQKSELNEKITLGVVKHERLSVQVNTNTTDVNVLKKDIENIKENSQKSYDMLSVLVDSYKKR